MDDRPTLLLIGARGIGGYEGGVEKFAEEFASRVWPHFRITAITLSPTREDLAAKIETVIARRSGAFNTDKLHYYGKAAALVLRREFDHVMILGINFAMIIALARLMIWRKTTIAVRTGSIDHTLDKWSGPLKTFIWASESMLRHADTVIAVSPYIQRHLARRSIESIHIGNGLGVSQHGAGTIGRDPRKVLAVGRVTHQKNYKLLLSASALLKDVDIEVIGGADTSPERAELEAMAKGDARIRAVFHGALPRAEVMRRLARAGLFVNCSLHEGMSNAVLEAIQQRVPIILSDIEANRDLGLPRHHYFDPRSAEELAEKIMEALSDAERFVAPAEQFSDWDCVIGAVNSEICGGHDGLRATVAT